MSKQTKIQQKVGEAHCGMPTAEGFIKNDKAQEEYEEAIKRWWNRLEDDIRSPLAARLKWWDQQKLPIRSGMRISRDLDKKYRPEFLQAIIDNAIIEMHDAEDSMDGCISINVNKCKFQPSEELLVNVMEIAHFKKLLPLAHRDLLNVKGVYYQLKELSNVRYSIYYMAGGKYIPKLTFADEMPGFGDIVVHKYNPGDWESYVELAMELAEDEYKKWFNSPNVIKYVKEKSIEIFPGIRV